VGIEGETKQHGGKKGFEKLSGVKGPTGKNRGKGRTAMPGNVKESVVERENGRRVQHMRKRKRTRNV